MNKEIYRFLGGSGTFKGTTINSLMKGARVGYCWPVFSPIKPWKKLTEGKLKGYIRQGNNMDLAALSLVTLEQNLWQLDHDIYLKTLFIERSVLDNLFYWCKAEEKDWVKDDDVKNLIRDIRKEELELATKYGWKEKKCIILSMEDPEFIENTILKESTRREWFPTVGDYLHFQKEYIEFIKKYIGETELYLRRIENAPIYLEKIEKGEVIPTERIN